MDEVLAAAMEENPFERAAKLPPVAEGEKPGEEKPGEARA
jgi:hypothetical protein